eukprot:8586637-Pyramimonas_sp.AAC.1
MSSFVVYPLPRPETPSSHIDHRFRKTMPVLAALETPKEPTVAGVVDSLGRPLATVVLRCLRPSGVLKR